MRNYKFITAYNIKHSLKETFASEQAFEAWLERENAPKQASLFQ